MKYQKKSNVNQMSTTSISSIGSGIGSGKSTLNIHHLSMSQRRNTMNILFGFMHDVLFHDRCQQVTTKSSSNSMYWMGHFGNDNLKLCCLSGIKNVIYYSDSNDVSESSKMSLSINRRD
jgi:hypothetical protein